MTCTLFIFDLNTKAAKRVKISCRTAYKQLDIFLRLRGFFRCQYSVFILERQLESDEISAFMEDLVYELPWSREFSKSMRLMVVANDFDCRTAKSRQYRLDV